MVQQLDHVGIVVRSLDRSCARYQKVLGLQVDHVEEYGAGLLRIAFLPVNGGDAGHTPKLELLEPLRPGSSAWDFLEAHGEGVEHLAFLVDGLDRALDSLADRHVPLRDRCSRAGAGGMRIAFLDPTALDGVLAELVSPIARVGDAQ